jgi:hypothetical protein
MLVAAITVKKPAPVRWLLNSLTTAAGCRNTRTNINTQSSGNATRLTANNAALKRHHERETASRKIKIDQQHHECGSAGYAVQPFRALRVTSRQSRTSNGRSASPARVSLQLFEVVPFVLGLFRFLDICALTCVIRLD